MTKAKYAPALHTTMIMVFIMSEPPLSVDLSIVYSMDAGKRWNSV
jgi:hypothetical protein